MSATVGSCQINVTIAANIPVLRRIIINIWVFFFNSPAPYNSEKKERQAKKNRVRCE